MYRLIDVASFVRGLIGLVAAAIPPKVQSIIVVPFRSPSVENRLPFNERWGQGGCVAKKGGGEAAPLLLQHLFKGGRGLKGGGGFDATELAAYKILQRNH